MIKTPSGCDLLSNSYLCVSNNSESNSDLHQFAVVICFQIPIFALAITVERDAFFEEVK